MLAIKRATDTGNRQRFNRLHGLSIVITLVHLGAAGWVLTRFIYFSPRYWRRTVRW